MYFLYWWRHCLVSYSNGNKWTYYTSRMWSLNTYVSSSLTVIPGLLATFFWVVCPSLFWPLEGSNYPSRSCNGPNGPKGPKLKKNINIDRCVKGDGRALQVLPKSSSCMSRQRWLYPSWWHQKTVFNNAVKSEGSAMYQESARRAIRDVWRFLTCHRGLGARADHPRNRLKSRVWDKRINIPHRSPAHLS